MAMGGNGWQGEVYKPNLKSNKSEISRLPLFRMHDTGKKVFILTNSDYPYTKDIMTYLMDTPSANGKNGKMLGFR